MASSTLMATGVTTAKLVLSIGPSSSSWAIRSPFGSNHERLPSWLKFSGLSAAANAVPSFTT